MYYDRQGRPINAMIWSVNHSSRYYRTVAQDRIRGWLVSTVWLGLDHNFGSGPPLIFETMVFPPDATALGFSEEYCERYATEEQARDGHYRALAWTAEKIRSGPPVQWRVVPEDLEGLT